MNKEKAALYASGAVFINFWFLLNYLHFSGMLMSVASPIPGMKALIEFGLIGTPAIIPALLTYISVYTFIHFQNLRKTAA